MEYSSFIDQLNAIVKIANFINKSNNKNIKYKIGICLESYHIGVYKSFLGFTYGKSIASIHEDDINNIELCEDMLLKTFYIL
jgi:hypothetical protein